MENQIRGKLKGKNLQKYCYIKFLLRYNQMQSIDTIINSYLVFQITVFQVTVWINPNIYLENIKHYY